MAQFVDIRLRRVFDEDQIKNKFLKNIAFYRAVNFPLKGK